MLFHHLYDKFYKIEIKISSKSIILRLRCVENNFRTFVECWIPSKFQQLVATCPADFLPFVLRENFILALCKPSCVPRVFTRTEYTHTHTRTRTNDTRFLSDPTSRGKGSGHSCAVNYAESHHASRDETSLIFIIYAAPPINNADFNCINIHPRAPACPTNNM